MNFPETGELKHRIMLKNWQDVPNASGSITQQKPDLLPVWAKREPVGALVYQGSVQIEDKITHRFYIRFRDDIVIDNNVLIICGGMEYRVRRCGDMEDAKRFLLIETEELGAV